MLSKEELIDYIRLKQEKIRILAARYKKTLKTKGYINPGVEKHVDNFIEGDVCECGGKLHKHRIIDWNIDMKYSIYKCQYKCVNVKTFVTPL